MTKRYKHNNIIFATVGTVGLSLFALALLAKTPTMSALILQWLSLFFVTTVLVLIQARLATRPSDLVFPLMSGVGSIVLIELAGAFVLTTLVEARDGQVLKLTAQTSNTLTCLSMAAATFVAALFLNGVLRLKTVNRSLFYVAWLPLLLGIASAAFMLRGVVTHGMEHGGLVLSPLLNAGTLLALLAAGGLVWQHRECESWLPRFALFALAFLILSELVGWPGFWGGQLYIPALFRSMAYLSLMAGLIYQGNLDLNLAELRAQNLFFANEEVQLQIEERKWTEELLKETRLFAESIVESIREPLLVLDSELRVIRANRPFYATFDLTSEDTLNHFIGDVANGQWRREALLGKLQAIVERDEPFENHEMSADFRGVGFRAVLVSGRRIDQKDRQTNLILLTIYDVTQQKVAQEKARLLTHGVESAADAIIMTDVHGTISYANPAMTRLTGLSAEEMLGEKPSIFKSGRHSEAEYREMWETILSGKVWSGEVTNQKKSGEDYDVHLTIAPVLDKSGKIEAFVSVQSDITELKRAREELVWRAEELARSNAELEQFAYIASHDLQEPLRMVSSYCQLLQRRYHDKLDNDANDFIGFAVDGAMRMQKLIDDLLTYCRVGTKGTPFQVTDCSRVVDNVLENLKVSIEDCDAKIKKEKLPITMADETQLAQVFQNLIANAVKFRKDDGPEISIGSRRRNGEWVISVKDNGIGIETDYEKRIFVIFQRLHSKETYPGTGIGLAVCKKIVERHGGRIWVKSKPGKGSTFNFTLPRVKEVEL